MQALKTAEIVIGPPRHLALLPPLEARCIPWPTPFRDGIDILLSHRGRNVVVLASGDPFWFGAGSVLARTLGPDAWQALPGPSCFSLSAAQMGWPLEQTTCLALHAAPFSRLRPHLAPGQRLIVTLRDGSAVAGLAAYLDGAGFGASVLSIQEALGGPRQRRRDLPAHSPMPDDIQHPVCVAFTVAGEGTVVPVVSGRPDALFDNDGQITKRPVRALTLSALAARPGEHLWDIGAGSGSIGIEWLLSHPSLTATAIEPRPDRAERIRANADGLGCDRLQIVTGAAPEALEGLAAPDVVFVGGGLDAALLARLLALPNGTRIVANAVTLETEAVLVAAQAEHGGTLLRAALSSVRAIGPKHGWQAAFPIVQWSHTL